MTGRYTETAGPIPFLLDDLVSAAIKVRPATAEDTPFKRTLYGHGRADELSELSWTDAGISFFIGEQYALQQAHIARHHPAAERLVIERFDDDNPEAIGHLDLDRSLMPWGLIDFALLPSERSKGRGGSILRSLQRQARLANAPIDLHVLLTSERARHFYLRHGFVEIRSATPSHQHMIWFPTDVIGSAGA